jgi:hypothetical protein
MGAQLLEYYEKVGKEFGSEGRMKLALLTMVTSMSASGEKDSPENIQKFENAIAQITRDVKS